MKTCPCAKEQEPKLYDSVPYCEPPCRSHPLEILREKVKAWMRSTWNGA